MAAQTTSMSISVHPRRFIPPSYPIRLAMRQRVNRVLFGLLASIVFQGRSNFEGSRQNIAHGTARQKMDGRRRRVVGKAAGRRNCATDSHRNWDGSQSPQEIWDSGCQSTIAHRVKTAARIAGGNHGREADPRFDCRGVPCRRSTDSQAQA